MTQLLEIANIVLPVFLVIALGFVLKVRGFIGPALNDGFSRMVFYVAAPALLFRSVATTTLAQPVNPDTISMTLGGSLLLSFVVCVVGTAALVSVVVSGAVYVGAARTGPARRGVLAQGAYRSNMVFVGLPVIANAFGPGALGPAAVFISFMTPLYNALAVILLTLPFAGGGAMDWKKAGRDMAKNPLIIACSLGLVCSALRVPLPGALDVTLKLVGEIAMPLALIVVGASLDFGRLRSRISLPLFVSVIKLIVYPALILAGLTLLGVSGQTLKFVVLLMAAPNAVVSTIMAREMNGDDQLAGAIVIMSTLGSLVTITGWLALFELVGY